MENIAENITKYMIKKNIIEENQLETYIYCFIILLSTLINLALVIAIGIIFEQIAFAIIFAICFIGLRHFAGGYHAKNHLSCISTILGLAIVGNLGIKYFLEQYIVLIIASMNVVSVITFILLAPIENVNKPLSSEEVKQNRKMSIIGIFIVASISSILMIINIDYVYPYAVSYTMIVVAELLVLGKMCLNKSKTEIDINK
ncbi:MAG: accessory gene regulator B family protein [Bacillota bacterium]